MPVIIVDTLSPRQVGIWPVRLKRKPLPEISRTDCPDVLTAALHLLLEMEPEQIERLVDAAGRRLDELSPVDPDSIVTLTAGPFRELTHDDLDDLR